MISSNTQDISTSWLIQYLRGREPTPFYVITNARKDTFPLLAGLVRRQVHIPEIQVNYIELPPDTRKAFNKIIKGPVFFHPTSYHLEPAMVSEDAFTELIKYRLIRMVYDQIYTIDYARFRFSLTAPIA